MHAGSNKRHAVDDDEMTSRASRSLGYVLKRDNEHENVQKVDYLGEQRYINLKDRRVTFSIVMGFIRFIVWCLMGNFARSENKGT